MALEVSRLKLWIFSLLFNTLFHLTKAKERGFCSEQTMISKSRIQVLHLQTCDLSMCYFTPSIIPLTVWGSMLHCNTKAKCEWKMSHALLSSAPAPSSSQLFTKNVKLNLSPKVQTHSPSTLLTLLLWASQPWTQNLYSMGSHHDSTFAGIIFQFKQTYYCQHQMSLSIPMHFSMCVRQETNWQGERGFIE